ncbi:peptidylprolyl isomerase [Rhodocytophaga rosea]|uniref:Periplasmic chaperone PpiD n=1 Tax=Rhodocytophaga rosea TaxID=2704465 RepID=A0A6C0GJU2_9BACT|nr:peptidylprolyl isomerase [Rhodocytophaga rosea]QHT68306.1 peptidylprolyl isomerase [Rhodocytophaga rosea]
MALIGKIKEKSGWAIGLIAISLGLFVVGGDILGPNSVILGNNSQDVGEIAGEDISIKEYSQELEVMKYNYTNNTGKNPTEEEMAGLREQAWNQLIEKIAYQKQYEKLGLAVSDDELEDMVQGDNVHPAVKQAFTNPATNQFDKSLVINYLKGIDTLPAQQQAAWINFENQLGPQRLRTKYENLLSLSSYVTKEEAKRDYVSQTAKADVKFLYVPFFSIPDSTIKVTDAQLEDYLNRNRDKYEGEETRTIEYVTFPVLPSAQDSAFFYDEIKNLAKGLASAQDDSTFAKTNTDVPADGGYVTLSEIPQQLQGDIATFIEGGMYGPYREGDTYSIYKLSDIKDDTVYSVRASHILFRADSTDAGKAEALKKAREVLQQIKGGASFEEMARVHGTDGTAQQGGDLGWYTQGGGFVKSFENALFSFNGIGLLPNPVETEFGYHLIKVTQPKTNRKYKLATIKKVISAGDATEEEAFRKADQFAGTTENREQFRENLKKDKTLTSFTAEKLRPNDNNVNALQNAREIVRWAFSEDTKVGDVSKEVFRLDNQYVVATLTGKTEKGDATVEDFRTELTSKVRNELKAEQITKKLANVTNIDAAAKAYGDQAQVNTATDVTLSSNTLQNVGFDPVAVGKIFGLKQGQRTKPFSGENGVLVIEMTKYTAAPDIADYSQYKNQLAQTYKSRTSYYVNEAVKDFAKIEDKRYKFY